MTGRFGTWEWDAGNGRLVRATTAEAVRCCGKTGQTDASGHDLYRFDYVADDLTMTFDAAARPWRKSPTGRLKWHILSI